ncbi:thiol:disulfide interchange protein DsbA/DsbL [Chitinilyticum piscinae]|uniref:Thiol:disulfide interchange protein n=1 Tax=Chitinilyticum piscinae TaxID=2866724 RepID=A0A8J7FEL3_9NEIS|nr:thiol:disulfide interchange protein DsbA/DsbL [Chitinilyticum piscinae]MBE9607983.1 thiol:disulfide interchange protein DsbA/DsbL [Chitinilyticum piscinae]
MRWLSKVMVMLGLLLAGLAQAAPQQGKDYTLLAKPMPVAVPGKIEVIEFYWYGCPHCNAIEPFVEAWSAKLPKDVNFRRIHINWEDSSRQGHVKLFLTLQAMGLDTKLQPAVFKAIFQDKLELRREEVLYSWLKTQGVDVEKFKGIYNGFSMGVMQTNLAKLTRDYGVDGVPRFIVNGRYVARGIEGAGEESVLKNVDALIAMERSKSGKAK